VKLQVPGKNSIDETARIINLLINKSHEILLYFSRCHPACRLQLLEKNVELAEKSFSISRDRFSDGDIDSQALALDRTRLNASYQSHLNAYISYKLLIADIMRKTFYDFEQGVPIVTN